MSESKWMVQLQAVLDCPVRQLQLPFHTWEAHKDEIKRLSAETSKQTNAVSTGDYVAVSDGPIWFALHGNQNGVEYLKSTAGCSPKRKCGLLHGRYRKCDRLVLRAMMAIRRVSAMPGN